MKNIHLFIAVQTPRSLATDERVRAFCEALRTTAPAFVPNKFGVAEPLKQTFDHETAMMKLADLYSPKGGSMFFTFKSPLDGQMQLNTSRGPRVPSNGVKIQLDYVSIATRLDEVITLVHSMIEATGAAYACATLSGGSPHAVHVDDPRKNWGEFGEIEVPPWNPSGLQSLPGICWINVFGPEYVSYLGKELLASLPAYRADFLSNDRGFWLQPTERPEDILTKSGRALADIIKTKIGRPKAFYGHDPQTSSFRAVYETPLFDFSELRLPPQPL